MCSQRPFFRASYLHILALKRKLRAAYWSVEVDDDERDYKWLKQTAAASGLRISKHSYRLVYNPAMVTAAEVAHAFDSDDEKRIGALFGYRRNGGSAGKCGTRSERASERVYKHVSLPDESPRHEKADRDDFDFEIRYRENGTFDDKVSGPKK